MTTNIKLMVVFSKLSLAFTQRLGKDLEDLGMPYSLYPILAHLSEVKRAKTQKLGQVAVISSGTITHAVNKLLKLGYVKKVQDEKDLRVFWVEITALGQTTFDEVHKEHMKYLDYLLEDFDETEKEAFVEQMKYFGKTIASK